MDNNEVRTIGYCEECSSEIISEIESDYEEDIYVDNEGRYFCSIECVLEYYGISKVER